LSPEAPLLIAGEVVVSEKNTRERWRVRISTLDNMTLVDLIVKKGEEAIRDLPERVKQKQEPPRKRKRITSGD